MAGTVAVENRSRRGGRRRAEHRATGADLTALVDIALLLLMFFMVSTNWNTPEVMEMTMPGQAMPVPPSHVLTVSIRPDGSLLCTTEGSGGAAGGSEVVSIDRLRALVNAPSMQSVPVIAVDAGDDVPYGTVIDVLDELLLAGADVRSVRTGAVVLDGRACAAN